MVLSKVRNNFLLKYARVIQSRVITSPWLPQEGNGFWVKHVYVFGVRLNIHVYTITAIRTPLVGNVFWAQSCLHSWIVNLILVFD